MLMKYAKALMPPPHTRRSERGAGTLTLTVILLFITMVSVFYTNRNVIFEQRTSANVARQASAQEVAEAGLEWAIGMLNHPSNIDANCNDVATAGTNFRKLYLKPVKTSFTPVTNIFPGCRRNGNAWTCSCPTAAGTASLGSTVESSFTVTFAPLAGYANVVQITSTGCTPQSAACTPASASGADANATVTALVKPSPLTPGNPAAAITCGTSCNFSGSFNAVNTDVATNGVLVNSGTTSNTPPGTTTLPGQPVQNAIIAGDTSLSSLAGSDTSCNQSKMFNAYFGTTLQEYQNAPGTRTIDCNIASCPTEIVNAYNSGWRAFYLPNGFSYNNSAGTDLGTPTDPVTLVSAGSVKINGNINIYGLLFSNDAVDNALGTGASNIAGALVTCAAFKTNGNGTVTYSPDVLNSMNTASGTIVKLLGSWRDW
jgi:Tfp pilus assembly protein PilX